MQHFFSSFHFLPFLSYVPSDVPTRDRRGKLAIALNSLCSTSFTSSALDVKLHCPYNDNKIQIKMIRFRPLLVDLIQYD